MKELDRVYQAIDRLTRWLIGAAFLVALLAMFTYLQFADLRVLKVQVKNLEKREVGYKARIEHLEKHHDLRSDETRLAPDP